MASLWACLWSSSTAAADASLRDLGQIYVWVDKLPADIRQDGLLARQLTQQATEHLRQARVSAQELLSDPSANFQPYLAIEVTALKIPEINRYVYGLALQVKQRVALARDPGHIAAGTTWQANSVGLTHIENVATKIEEALGDLLDQFVDAYARTNPLPLPPPPTPTPTPTPPASPGF